MNLSLHSRGMAAGCLLCLLMAAGAAHAGFPSAGPDYDGPPPVDMPASFKNVAWKKAQPRDAEPRGEWWRVFHDPVLDRLEEQAMAANQDIALAVDRIAEVRAQVRVAAADFYPGSQLAPSAVRQRTTDNAPFQRGELIGRNPFGAAPGAAAGAPGASGAGVAGGGPLVLDTQPLSRTYNIFNLPVDLNWELDLFGRVRRNREAAKATAEAAAADLRNTLLSVAANVAGAYYQIRSTDAEIGVLERTIATRRDGLHIAQERLGAGLSSELDVARATADLAGTEADIEGVRRSRMELENALATLEGCPSSDFSLKRRAITETRLPSIPPGLPSTLLERRPDIASAERQLAAANARIGVAVAAFFPVIKLTGAAGFQSAELGDIFAWESRVWQIGPSITLPIFEGGRNTAGLQAARARYREQVDAYRKQVLTAFQEVETSLGDLRTLSLQGDAQERAVAAAVKALQLSQSQYGKGAINFLDVLDAERTLLADERATVQLLGQRLQATVMLIKALGGTF